MDLLLIGGRPGSGKSTVAQELRDIEPGIEHLSIGNRLRAIGRGAVKSAYSSAILDSINALNNSNRLDDSIVNSVVLEFIESVNSDSSLVIVDGYPRFTEQITPLRLELEANDIGLAGLIHITVDRQTAINRILSRGSREGERDVTTDFASRRVDQHDIHYTPVVESLSQFTEVIEVESQSSSAETTAITYNALKGRSIIQ